MQNFKGEYEYTIDAKGRMNVPASFREILPPEAKKTFVVTRGLDKCLAIYTLDVWEEKIEEKLRQLPTKARHYMRIVASQAREAKMDEQGRILIPKNLMQWAEIDSKVTVAGALERIELWNPERFEKYKEQNQSVLEEISEEFQI
jgi:MraZ protein